MPKRSASRSQERQRRRAQAARRRQRRERELVSFIQSVEADYQLLRDRSTSPEEAAATLERLFNRTLLTTDLGQRLVTYLGESRSQEIAAAARREGAGASALAFAADVALLLGSDPKSAKGHIERALQLQDHPALRTRLAWAEAELGQLITAVTLIDKVLEQNPDEERAGLLRGDWLERLAALESEPHTACPCASGRSFAGCCRDQARVLLAHFTDRGPLYELREAVVRYPFQRRDLLSAAEATVARWVEDGALAPEDVDWEGLAQGAPEAQELRLVIEGAWSAPLDEDDDEDRSVLSEFAADPANPPEMARWAREWDEHAIWGIWQLERRGDPGCLLTNYLTGVRLYAEIPTEQGAGLPRWAVLLGYFSPLGGIWHSGGAFYQATPGEGRSLARFAIAFVGRVARHERGDGSAAAQWAAEAEREIARGSWVPGLHPAPTPVAELVNTVSAVIFAGLVARLKRARASALQLANTDGDPLESIDAELRVADPEGAFQALLARADFETDGERLVWQGREMTKGEHEQALAHLRSQGLEPPPDAVPGHYTRGWLSLRPDGLTAAVNSRARLERLVAVLAELGHPAEVAAETVSNMTEELEQQTRWLPPAPTQPRLPDVAAAWLRTLPDEAIPALDGLTPRQAAQDAAYLERLENFVRDIEYQISGGGTETDLPSLRESLAREPS